MKKLAIFLGILFATLSAGVASASLYDYYAEFGQKLPSIEARRLVAESYGILNYTGTRAQNIDLESFLRVDVESLGATSPVAGTTYYLYGGGVTVSATSIILQSLKIPQTGYLLQDSDFSTTFHVTFEPGNTRRQEIASCTTVTQNGNGTATLSGCTRALLPFAPFTASSTYGFSHAGGTSLIFSDPPQLLNEYAAKGNNELITGLWQFAQLPTSTTSTPTDQSQLITLYQFQQATSTGGTNGTTTVKGVYEAATDAELQTGAVFGSTGAPLAAMSQSHNQTSTANKVPVSNGSGKLNQTWLDLTQGFTFAGNVTTSANANITSSTITQLNLPGVNVNSALYSLFGTFGVSTTVSGAATTTFVSTTIPGNYFPTSSVIRFTANLSNLKLQTTVGAIFTFSYGASSFSHTIFNLTGVDFSGGAFTFGGTMTYLMFVSSTPSSQSLFGSLDMASTTPPGATRSTSTFNIINTAPSPSFKDKFFTKDFTTDSTSNNTLRVQMQMTDSNTVNAIVVDNFTLEVLRFKTPQ